MTSVGSRRELQIKTKIGSLLHLLHFKIKYLVFSIILRILRNAQNSLWLPEDMLLFVRNPLKSVKNALNDTPKWINDTPQWINDTPKKITGTSKSTFNTFKWISNNPKLGFVTPKRDFNAPKGDSPVLEILSSLQKCVLCICVLYIPMVFIGTDLSGQT